jgi:DNA gyrase subunit B
MARCGSNLPVADTSPDLPVLTGMECVRRRPGMYIGNVEAGGLFNLLFDLVTGSLAEAVAGHGREVRVTLRADGSAEVADDGRSPPNIEHAFTVLGPGHHGYCPYPGGRDYFWHPVANALSERLLVVVRSDGSTHQHTFQRGVTHAAVQSGGPPGACGMTIAFRPDPLIFGDARFDADAIRDRLRQLAFLHSGVRLTFTDETTGSRDTFEFADGIRECVRHLNANRVALHPDVILLRGEEHGMRYEVGLQWCDGNEETIWSFANHYRTPQGGTHTAGLRSGITRGLHDLVRDRAPESVEFKGEDFREGLAAVVSVWLADPMFEGATRARLSSPEAETVVAGAVRRGVREYFEANAEAADRVIQHVVAAAEVRIAASAIRARQRRIRNDE